MCWSLPTNRSTRTIRIACSELKWSACDSSCSCTRTNSNPTKPPVEKKILSSLFSFCSVWVFICLLFHWHSLSPFNEFFPVFFTFQVIIYLSVLCVCVLVVLFYRCHILSYVSFNITRLLTDSSNHVFFVFITSHTYSLFSRDSTAVSMTTVNELFCFHKLFYSHYNSTCRFTSLLYTLFLLFPSVSPHACFHSPIKGVKVLHIVLAYFYFCKLIY